MPCESGYALLATALSFAVTVSERRKILLSYDVALVEERRKTESRQATVCPPPLASSLHAYQAANERLIEAVRALQQSQ